VSYVRYVDSSQFEPHRRAAGVEARTTERTPLGKAARWVADKSLNTLLDSFLRIFLSGEWYVRLAGAVVTGVAAGSTVWLVTGSIQAFRGTSVPAVTIGLGAVAGLVMGYGAGLLLGAGAGWLLAIIAESIGTELSKDPLGLYFEAWAVWCLSLVVGGVAGWVVGRVADHIQQRSAVAGLAVRLLSYVLLFVSTAVVLIRTGASAALWKGFAELAATTGPQSDALAVGVGLGVVCAVVAAFYWLRLVPTAGRFFRLYLPLSQAIVTAMLWTLAVIDSTAGSTVSVAALLSVVVCVAPWAPAVATWGVREAWWWR
jgi:MFS family permease